MKFCFCSLSIIILEEWDGMAAFQQHAIFQTFLNRGKETFLKDLSTKILPQTCLEDYDIIRSLGHGSYGQVVAAKNIITGKICALKVIKKKKIVSEDQVKHLISEIRILNAIKFEFLVSLECYFTNQCHVFLVLPYVPGGQLLRLLKKVRKLDEFPAKFFAGQIVLAIEYLHANGIVHRDIKPENILLDANGYLKLVDFGFAKVVRNNYTYTFCGTPEYIAPEILLSKGYSKSPDWWAFGILLYEMCSGSPPFVSRNELRLYEKILIGHVIFPDYFSPELKSIITGLLQVNKSKRLGCMKNDVEDVKFHDWFKNIDWIALWNKQLISPYSAKKPVELEVLDRYFSFLNTNDWIFGKNNLIRKAKDFRQCFAQYVTAASELTKNEKDKKEVENAKRSRIPREGKKLKPLKANFLCDLFAGLFDLNVFEYPIPLTPLEVDSLLIHSDDVENFIKKIDDPINVSPHLMSELKKLELFGLSIPQKYGGLGYTETETKFMLEVLSAIPFLGHLVGRSNSLCNKILTLQGTEEQKSHYLPMFASGDSFGCFAFLEKSPIIDIKAMQTQTAYSLKDKHFVLNGNKKHVCNVDIADSIIVLNLGQKEEKSNLKNFFNYCIVDKNAPGVEVKEITSDNNDKHFGLHEINFDNVVVQPENIIGGEAGGSFTTLKMIMASNNLSASAVCLAMLKNLLHTAIALCNTRTYLNQPLKSHAFIQNIIGQLTMYTYVVESVVYMASGRFDIFYKPELFPESCVAKLLAVDFLQLGIQNYLELVACDTFKMKNILEAAIKVLNYYSVMDETQTHLKLMIGSEGLIHSVKLSNTLKENVGILRKPYNYPGKILWFSTASREKRLQTFLSKFNLKMEVNKKLSMETDFLQDCFGLMNLAIETQFTRHGCESGNDETCVPKLGEIAAYIYALTACISRASTSYCGYLENAEDEIAITENFSFFTKVKVERLVDEVMYLSDTPELYTKVGLKTFENKQYPPQHPLTRTY